MGFPATPAPSPWVQEFQDSSLRKVTISVAFNEATRATTSATVGRDPGCLFHTVVLDDPGNSAKRKPVPAPADGELAVAYTAQQLRTRQISNIDDAMGVQITAEP